MKWKIKFVTKDIELFADAIALFWINEIHISERYKNHPALKDILKHEARHMEFMYKAMLIKSRTRQYFNMIHNNLWDQYDIMRIQFHYFKKRFFYHILKIFLFLIALTILIIAYITK